MARFFTRRDAKGDAKEIRVLTTTSQAALAVTRLRKISAIVRATAGHASGADQVCDEGAPAHVGDGNGLDG